MRISEVSQAGDPDPDRLMGLVQFLAGRADDQAARKQISQEAFIKLARQLGVIVTPSNLAELIDKPPLSNLLEPLDPNSGVLVFKGGEQDPAGMPVNQAQDIVAGMAKRANPLG